MEGVRGGAELHYREEQSPPFTSPSLGPLLAPPLNDCLTNGSRNGDVDDIRTVRCRWFVVLALLLVF